METTIEPRKIFRKKHGMEYVAQENNKYKNHINEIN